MLGIGAAPVSEPPEIDLKGLIAAAMHWHAERRISPVKYLQLDDRKERVPGIWRPNYLRRCYRQQVYRVFKVPKDPVPFDLERQFNFDRGHVFGAWFVAYLRAAQATGCLGVEEVLDEVVVHHPGLALGGKYDIAFKVNGYWYAVEVKSKDNAKAMRDMKSADRDHLDQLNDYLGMMGIRAGWVVYKGPALLLDGEKTKLKIRTFFHRFNEESWRETEVRIRQLEFFRKDSTLIAPKTSKPWFECKDCPWKWACDRDLSPAAALEERRA